jgi:hypothetical protein
MDYKKKYEKLVDAVKVLRDNNPSDEGIQNWVNDNVPELKENEDERIKKEIIDYIKTGTYHKKWIAWLEKQGNKPQGKSALEAIRDEKVDNANKIEPKFHEGEWVVSKLDRKARQISEVHFDEYNSYYVVDGKEFNLEEYDRLHHSWTIKDAKDGDVLAFDNDTIVIFKDLYNSTSFHSYCHIEDGIFDFNKDELPDWWSGEGFKPATKEQIDILFQKMKEAGCEWDAEKKELRKEEVK